jgi:hypothetical protein
MYCSRDVRRHLSWLGACRNGGRAAGEVGGWLFVGGAALAFYVEERFWLGGLDRVDGWAWGLEIETCFCRIED